MVEAVFIAFIVPFLAFYILKDFDVFERAVIHYVPKSHRKNTVRLLKDIDEALGSYIRGQLLVCLIVGILAYIGYLLVGMPYALLFASIVAITNVIPYLGPFIGAAPALLMASTVSVKMMLLVVIVNTVCQILEGNIISPQVVGRTLHLHPLADYFCLTCRWSNCWCSRYDFSGSDLCYMQSDCSAYVCLLCAKKDYLTAL